LPTKLHEEITRSLLDLIDARRKLKASLTSAKKPQTPQTNDANARDLFAAHALQALITRDNGKADFVSIITTTAFQYADDMMIEREEPVVVPRVRHKP
tara:strand:+ start:398 stop:691 length:294 start_codon:yes stop_codon:yes gene_type:complete